jgi:hypothetical protein
MPGNISRNITVLFLTFLLPVINPLVARETKDTIKHHTVKANILAPTFFRNLSLYYEYGLNEHWSLQLGAAYKFGGSIPAFIGLGGFVVSSESSGIRGYSVAPEARYYFSNCNCGNQKGLYLGFYGKVLKLYGDITFSYWSDSQSRYIDIGGSGDMREFGFGFQLGYQFTIRERFMVDLMFMGPRTSFHHLKLEMDSQFASEVIPRIEDEINERLAWWGIDPVSIPKEGSTTVDFRFNNFRYAIAIGYRF